MNLDQKVELEDQLAACLQEICDKLSRCEPILGEAFALGNIIENNLKDFEDDTQRKLGDLLPKLKDAVDRGFMDVTI